MIYPMHDFARKSHTVAILHYCVLIYFILPMNLIRTWTQQKKKQNVLEGENTYHESWRFTYDM